MLGQGWVGGGFFFYTEIGPSFLKRDKSEAVFYRKRREVVCGAIIGLLATSRIDNIAMGGQLCTYVSISMKTPASVLLAIFYAAG
jgi:hypothetical protein